MGFYIWRASGRAKCQICGQIIKKGSIAIGYSGYRLDAQCHQKCLTIKGQEKQEVIEKLVNEEHDEL
jgi:hypothetical protein